MAGGPRVTLAKPFESRNPIEELSALGARSVAVICRGPATGQHFPEFAPSDPATCVKCAESQHMAT